MKININSVHFSTDKKLEQFIEKKVNKVVERTNDVTGVDVILKLENTKDKENKIAEIKIDAKGKDFFSKKQADSFEESVDLAVDALKKQIDKHKEKKN